MSVCKTRGFLLQVACMPNLNKLIFLIAFSAISSGAFIYLLWRQDYIRVFTWLDLFGFNIPVELIRSYSYRFLPLIPEWVVFSLPNGLWAFSYALIISHIWWGQNNSVSKYFWLISIFIVGLGYEALQYLGVIPGTFCYQDLLLCVIGVFGGTATAILITRRRGK